MESGKWKIDQREAGYTLIEILVAITIASLLFGIGYVSFREFSRRQALAATSRSLKGDLRLTQELALSGKKPTSGCNTLDGYNFRVSAPSSYTIGAVCGVNNCSNNSNFCLKTVTLASGVTINTPSVNPILFKVLAQGTNIGAGSSTTITLTQGGTGSVVNVMVSASGEIK